MLRRCRRLITRPLNRGLTKVLPWPYHLLIGGVWRSSRTVRLGDAELRAALREEGGAVVAFYHENLLHMPYVMRHQRGVGLSSGANAGGLIAGILEHFGYLVVRTRKHEPIRTLRDVTAAMRSVPGGTPALALAVDGSKGPRREVKPGAALTAIALDIPVFAMHVAVRRGVDWPSWDRCRVPLPFNRIVMRTDRVDRAGARDARQLTARIQRQLDATVSAAERAVAAGRGTCPDEAEADRGRV